MTSPHAGRSAASALALALLLAGCSGSSSRVTPGSPAPATPGSAAATASPAADVGAAAALARVRAVMRGVHSYAFAATETVGSTTTHLSGRVVRPAGVFYTLTTRTRTEQIVRTGATTYRRVLPGPYRRLVHPQPAIDPLHELVAVLQRLSDVRRSSAPGGTAFTGTLDREGAIAAGLVTGAKGGAGVVVPVLIVTDVHARVTQLSAQIPLRVSGHAVTARVTTRFSGFDAQLPVRAPR